MKDQSVIGFGYTIAYVLPGGAAILVLGLGEPSITAWISELASKEVSLGGFLFFGGAATTAGLVLQAARWLLFEAILGQRFVSFPALDDSKRALPGVAEALAEIREHHYRHYQSYGAFFIALLPVPFLTTLSPVQWGLWVVGQITLLATTRDCMKRLRDKTAAVLKYESPLRAA